MKSFSTAAAPIPNIHLQMEICKQFQNKLSSIILCFLSLSTIFILFISHPSNPFSFNQFLQTNTTSPLNSSNLEQLTNQSEGHSQYNERIIAIPPTSSYPINTEKKEIHNQTMTIAIPPSSSDPIDTKKKEIHKQTVMCDLFAGKWVRDGRGSIYTNKSCATLPDVRNCGRHGKEQGYVYWRWKPDGCELPMFDPEMFLRIVRGKKLMFIGDSLARNQMESLLCLLSQAETPLDSYKDPKDKHRTWYFPTHDFTLMVIWTEFLVEGNEIIINGTASNTFTINLDGMNPIWADKLPELKYAVINGGNWFTRKTYIHSGGKLIGCVHCWGENIPSISVLDGIRMIFRAAFQFISECAECKDLLALLRTYSMSHFEHGSWFTGGYCNRTEPLSESDLSMRNEAWEFRRIQMEEMERVKREGKRRFEVLDVTKAMMLRADAHPGRHWVAKVTSDCLHWCLPGPIDMWNELLLEVLKKNA